MIDYLLPRKIETLVTIQIKKGFQEYTIVRSSFFIKKRLWHRCFPLNFAKFLRTPFLQNTSGRLFLYTAVNCFKTLNLTFRLYNLLHWFILYGSMLLFLFLFFLLFQSSLFLRTLVLQLLTFSYEDNVFLCFRYATLAIYQYTETVLNFDFYISK